MRRWSGSHEDVAREIARLLELDRAACLACWRSAFGGPAPRHISVRLMQKVLAHDVQTKAFGGMPSRTRQGLRSIVAAQATKKSTVRMNPGTRLMREWNGRTHEIEVLEDGFLWKGRRFRSLSAIAREITGARWSGPRFFGVRE